MSTNSLPSNVRAALCTGPGQVEVRSVGKPKLLDPLSKVPFSHGVLVKVIASGIGAADRALFFGDSTRPNSILGHEVLGEVVQCGADVRTLKDGDFVSVPFNVACGRCGNCASQRTHLCEHTHSGVYGAGGAWSGGLAEYMRVAYADFNCLKLPDKQLAMRHLFDLTLLADTLPAAMHACKQTNVDVGKTVLVVGAGSTGLCVAMCALRLLGAAAVIIADANPERIRTAKAAAPQGLYTLDLSEGELSGQAVKRLIGQPFVDCVIDATNAVSSAAAASLRGEDDSSVHFDETHFLSMVPAATGGPGNTMVDGPLVNKLKQSLLSTEGTSAPATPNTPKTPKTPTSPSVSSAPVSPTDSMASSAGSNGDAIDGLVKVCDYGGSIFIMDECSTCNKPNAKVSLPLSLCITKAITISFGSCPVGKYNAELLRAILHGHFSVYDLLGVKVLRLDEVAVAFKDAEGAHKYIVDPNNVIRDHFVAQKLPLM